MTTPPRPPLKSLPATSDRPSSAEPARTPAGSGAPKVAAEGVLSALRPNPHIASERDEERVFFGLHIVAPPDWRAPTSATAACPCGYQDNARGRTAILRLVEDYMNHKETNCPHYTGVTERRKAA
ncbi:hypothetical protein SAMN05428945_2200 [Streptomyces sp. 2224.1]|uniref:hypothetical protein n=1 Tax=Streptomyces sp. 2224.1 TaxID=1881020 RepID=UPI000899D7F6|nr:hypothetical protein [Streptomyces sp. 2224.1]SEC16321.1 hypothetical protein SAMN05428945_2200 [Streptomyces sp. 2224.1]